MSSHPSLSNKLSFQSQELMIVLLVEFTAKNHGLPKYSLQIFMVLLTMIRKCQERPQMH